jgi:retinol dehydrogenase-12
MGGPPSTTPRGHEMQFGTNHVGHALLFKLLLPLLLATPGARIISTSSRGHKVRIPAGGIVFETLKSPQPELSGVLRYTQSKLANVIYARQIAKHHPSLTSIAIHPEDVLTQLFNKGAVGGGPEIEYLAREIAPKVGVSLEEGVKNGLWAATAGEVESGRYYEPVGKLGGGSELSRDGALGEKLWEWTEGELEGVEI